MSSELPVLKNGNLFVDRISVAGSRFAPGQDISVQVAVSNGAIVIDTRNDTDACRHRDSPCETPGIHEPFGYCTRVRITPDWAEAITERKCVKSALLGVGTETFSFTLTAPDVPGEHDITITLIADGSEQRGSTTRTITVTGSNGDGGDDDQEDDQDGGLGMDIPNEVLIAGGGILVGLGLLALARRRRPAAPATPQLRRHPPPRRQPTTPRDQ